MASGSESAAERVEPIWEVGPTENVVQALMEALVDHHFPLTDSSVPPSEDDQIAVAKQMHAVVLLYNYHHRKQKPELEFLEFVNFCKLAIVIRPYLTPYIKMAKSKLTELNGAEDCLSVTEKAIKDACDISLGLDASRDVPNMEGWPISKVAVLLIDSTKDNFMLQYGAVTTGAWSLIEKELSECSTTPEISAGDQVSKKRKRDNLNVSTYNTELLQLGYDAVKDVTGISSSDLEVLETHMAYSLSKEKSAACFYIMQYSGSFNEDNEVPLCAVESMQGPIAVKFADGSWKATRLVEFHHVLPYLEFISCWISGYGTKVNSSDKKASENCCSNNKCDMSSHEHVGSPVDIFQSTENDGNLTMKFVKSFDILDSAESCQNGILENIGDESEEPDKGLSCNPSRVLCEMEVDVDNTKEEFEKGCDRADPASEVVNSETKSDVPVSGHALLGKTVVDDNVREKVHKKLDVGHSAGLCEMEVDVGNTKEEFEKGSDRADPASEVVNSETKSDVPVSGHALLGKTVVDDNVGEKVNEKLDVGHSAGLCEMEVDVDNTKEEFEKGSDRADPASEVVNSETKSDVPVSGHVLLGKTVVDDNVMVKVIEKLDVGNSAENDERRICPEILDEDTVGCSKNILSGPPRAFERTNMNHLTNICSDSENTKGLNSKLNVYHLRSKENSLKIDAQLCKAVPDLKADMVDTLDLNHTQRIDEKVSEENGLLTNACNLSGTVSTGEQAHNRRRDETVSQFKGDRTQQCNRVVILALEIPLPQTLSASGKRGQHTEKINHNISAQSTLNSAVQDHIQSKYESNHANECSRTGIVATENQVAQFEAEFYHDLGVHTLSSPDQRENALALIYRKRRELYSELCNWEDKLALYEADVARIRVGGDVDLARQYVKSAISGNFDSLLESRTSVQDNGNFSGKCTRLSEAYLPGKSSCQDLKYTCERNNWRLPRYLTETLDGKFRSNVFVQINKLELQAEGGFVSDPREARETAAAEMFIVMKKTFL